MIYIIQFMDIDGALYQLLSFMKMLLVDFSKKFGSYFRRINGTVSIMIMILKHDSFMHDSLIHDVP